MPVFHRPRPLCCAIALALALSPAAHASDANDPADANARTTTLDSVNVQAAQASAPGSLDEQRLSNGVNSVMSKQQIDAIPSAGIADVVAHLPGLSAYSDMHLGQATTGENASSASAAWMPATTATASTASACPRPIRPRVRSR